MADFSFIQRSSMFKLNLRFTQQTAIFIFIMAAHLIYVIFNPAYAQPINQTAEEIVANILQEQDLTATQYQKLILPDESNINPERSYVLNLKNMNKSVFCLAQNAYFEAGGESFKGKLAVTQVVQNRADSNDYPDTACGVVKEMTVNKNNKRTCQFSWWCAGKREIPLYDRSGQVKPKVYQVWYDCVKAALLVYNKKAEELVSGATHFYAHRNVNPSWSKNMKVVAVIGNHKFVASRN